MSMAVQYAGYLERIASESGQPPVRSAALRQAAQRLIDLDRENQGLQNEIERLRAECNEQARLLGISGSREAKLMADIEALRKELAEANSFIESLANACEVAEARVLEYSREG